jgi:hypothetical protein
MGSTSRVGTGIRMQTQLVDLDPVGKKYFPKAICHHNEQPNILTRQEYKGKIYAKNIRKKIM